MFSVDFLGPSTQISGWYLIKPRPFLSEILSNLLVHFSFYHPVLYSAAIENKVNPQIKPSLKYTKMITAVQATTVLLKTLIIRSTDMLEKVIVAKLSIIAHIIARHWNPSWSHLNRIHIFASYFFKIIINIILPSMISSSKIHSSLPAENIVGIFILSKINLCLTKNVISCTLKIKSACSSPNVGTINQTTRNHALEHCNLHVHSTGNNKYETALPKINMSFYYI